MAYLALFFRKPISTVADVTDNVVKATGDWTTTQLKDK